MEYNAKPEREKLDVSLFRNGNEKPCPYFKDELGIKQFFFF